MPFFVRNKSNANQNQHSKKGKRKLPQKANEKSGNSKLKKLKNGLDEVISSDDDFSDHYNDESADSSEEETAQEKKLRVAKAYLEQIRQEESEKAEFSGDVNRAVAHRLKEEALEEAGRLYKKRAHEYQEVPAEILLTLKGHKTSVTCLVISSCEKFIYSGSKDCSIIKWSTETGKRLQTIPGVKNGSSEQVGHSAHILAITLSSDDKFLVTGCAGNIVNVWNPITMEFIKTFRGHKAAICGLTFTKGSHQLISASSDRSLKLWNLDEMGYIETLFGHQDGVAAIDNFLGETAVTCGGRDSTVRVWKIVEESQLVFQGHGASIDCVCVTSPQHFVSGADDGSLSLWGVNKKKPLFKLPHVHGHDVESEEPHWINSLCALRNTDLFASGSKDGYIRLWKRGDEQPSINPVSTIPANGFVNALCFSPSGKYLVAGLGQEHKLGRWWRIKEAKNVIVIYSWQNKT